MLLPNHLEYLVRKEQHKDLIRQAEQARLISQAEMAQQVDHNHDTYHKLMGRIGRQMVQLGEKLEAQGNTPSRKAA